MPENDHVIEITTKSSYEIYRKFYMFSLFRGRFYKQGPVLFYVVCIVGIVAVLLLGFLSGFGTGDIIFLSILIALIILMLYLMYIYPKKHYTSGKIKGVINKYRFTEDHMSVESASELASGVSKVEYSALYRVYNTHEMILIYVNNLQAFIIPKKDSNPEDIKKLNRDCRKLRVKSRNSLQF